ncbi:CHAD domain-containing protein [Pseudomonas zhanjiangensis]|uniref:CHAD domain-containing protein n=1 Tax=Pseudomonas zhanjiangensis TaxID=3239015 RepID=A0ABV3YUR7_9PSED
MKDQFEAVLTTLLRLQVALYACHERMAAGTDAEALHDLRVTLRRLRSLLRPLRKLPACAQLQQRAAAFGHLSGPVRDLEVLLAHLQAKGPADAFRRRQPQVRQGHSALLDSAELSALFAALDAWPALWREARADGQLDGLHKRIRRRLRKQQRQLAAALLDPAHDRHRLRLLIKRVRYGAEAYPQQAGLSGKVLMRLKQAQSELGDWHDYFQWLARAEQEPDLQPCVDGWRRAMRATERAADQALEALRLVFASGS